MKTLQGTLAWSSTYSTFQLQNRRQGQYHCQGWWQRCNSALLWKRWRSFGKSSAQLSTSENTTSEVTMFTPCVSTLAYRWQRQAACKAPGTDKRDRVKSRQGKLQTRAQPGRSEGVGQQVLLAFYPWCYPVCLPPPDKTSSSWSGSGRVPNPTKLSSAPAA